MKYDITMPIVVAKERQTDDKSEYAIYTAPCTIDVHVSAVSEDMISASWAEVPASTRISRTPISRHLYFFCGRHFIPVPSPDNEDMTLRAGNRNGVVNAITSAACNEVARHARSLISSGHSVSGFFSTKEDEHVLKAPLLSKARLSQTAREAVARQLESQIIAIQNEFALFGPQLHKELKQPIYRIMHRNAAITFDIVSAIEDIQETPDCEFVAAFSLGQIEPARAFFDEFRTQSYAKGETVAKVMSIAENENIFTEPSMRPLEYSLSRLADRLLENFIMNSTTSSYSGAAVAGAIFDNAIEDIILAKRLREYSKDATIMSGVTDAHTLRQLIEATLDHASEKFKRRNPFDRYTLNPRLFIDTFDAIHDNQEVGLSLSGPVTPVI